VVAEQVHLVDVEHTAVRLGEQAGLEGAGAVRQNLLQIQRAGDPVLAGADRELV
jgi:hypothetical protein